MKNKDMNPVVEPVKRKPSLSDEAYKAVKNAIARGSLEPGDWLCEEPLGRWSRRRRILGSAGDAIGTSAGHPGIQRRRARPVGRGARSAGWRQGQRGRH
jgi:hypothetical protein